ncbi:MAG: hypothetical protein ACE5HU_00880 [Acidobacteriota bacterium]
MIGRLLVGLVVSAVAAAGAQAGVIEVQVKLPMAEKIDTTGMSRLLVAGFRASDHPTVEVGKEVVHVLRGLFRKHTRFEVLDVDPLPLPEQSIEEAVRNTAYWRRVGKRYNADLIVAGTADFGTEDQSGFVDRDYISPRTGQRLRQSRWVERESFQLKLGMYFLRGSSGDLLYEDHFEEEMLFNGKSTDDLTVLLQEMESIGNGVLAIVSPRPRVESRYLFTD